MSKKRKERKEPEALPALAQRAGHGRRTVLFTCLSLALITWLVFGQTIRHGFVNYDDPSYVYENSRISGGLTLSNLAFAFTQSHARNWHPVTTISHLLDCELFGLWPGGHHLTNVLLHSAVVVLLFLLLLQMTEALWRSAFVAALFAIHPLRVESVAWIAERKDVMSGLFFVLTGIRARATIEALAWPTATGFALDGAERLSE